jgi:hypothetical protein
MYYNAVLTPWLSAAPDLQIIDPALERTLDASGVQLRDMNTSGARAAYLLALLTVEQGPHT